MKVTIHIRHGEADNIAEVEAAARRLGLTVTTRGDFMGNRHVELAGEMNASTLADLLDVTARLDAVAA